MVEEREIQCIDDCYEILHIVPGAGPEAVRSAYRERVKEAHPDHGGSAREFQRVRAAYEELKDGSHLEDGDEIIMKGYCEREGFRRIGLGECRGRVLPAS